MRRARRGRARAGHQKARRRSNTLRVRRGEHAVAVGAAERVAARVEPVRRRLGGEHRDVVGEQGVQAQRVDRLVRVAGDLPPGVHAAVGAPGDRQLQRLAVGSVSPRIVCSARSSSSCTVRSPGLARPAGEVGAVVLERELRDHRRAQRAAAAARRSDELDEDHLGRVAAARTELEDARVAAGAVGVAGRDVLEQLVHGELVLRERRQRLAARVQVAALGERDQLLDLRLDRLGLRLASS